MTFNLKDYVFDKIRQWQILRKVKRLICIREITYCNKDPLQKVKCCSQ